MKRQHRHAEMIRKWLDDDSLKVEIEHPHCPYWEFVAYPRWDENRNYRFRPKMIKCGDMEFPEPMRKAPEIKALIWAVDISQQKAVYEADWIETPYDLHLLKRGLVHSTKEAAEAHARALIALTEEE